MKRLLALALTLSVAACDTSTKTADGTSSETQTTVAVRFYREDGNPAVGASVQLFASGDTTRIPCVQLKAGLDGGVELPRIPEGKYSLIALDGMGNGVLNHDIVSTPTGLLSMHGDTLRPVATVVGKVRLQPQDEGRPIRLQIPGTGAAVWSDSTGRFRISVPASWRSQLLATTPSESYTATVRDIRVDAGEILDLGEFEMSYHGLPVVEGVAGAVLQGGYAIRLEWMSIRSGRVRDYQVLRSKDSGVALDVFRSNGQLDTTFVDSIYRPDWIDVNSHRLDYSVRVVDSSAATGVAWRHVSFQVNSPFSRGSSLLSIDTLGLLPDGCTELDTLSDGLVCLSQMDAGQRFATTGNALWKGLRRADSLRVWFSADGRRWGEPLEFPRGALRAVPWNGGIWLVRGMESGDSIYTSAGGNVVLAAGLKAAVVEGWTPRGERIRTDTLLSKEGSIGHRLMVRSGVLSLSDDMVKFYEPFAFHGALRIRQLGADGTWSERIPPEVLFDEDRTARDNPEVPLPGLSSPVLVPGGAPWHDWGALQILRVGGYLLGRNSADVFPWRIASPGALAMVRYRGDGIDVPAILVWNGCGVVMEEERRLLRICHAP